MTTENDSFVKFDEIMLDVKKKTPRLSYENKQLLLNVHKSRNIYRFFKYFGAF